jgi:hypothetical protein
MVCYKPRYRGQLLWNNIQKDKSAKKGEGEDPPKTTTTTKVSRHTHLSGESLALVL